MNLAPATRRRRRRSAAAAPIRSEEGFTLVELLVAITLLTAVLAGASTLLVGMMTKQPDLTDRSEQVAEARVALEKMMRDLRSGYAVDSALGTASTVTFRTYMRRTCQGGVTTVVTLCQVTYTCSATTKICTRRTANANGTSPTVARQLIAGVSNTDIFTIQKSYIGIKLVLPTQDGRGALTVSDGARLRNAPL